MRVGSLWMILASFLFAWTGVFAKLGFTRFDAAEMMFYRGLLGLSVTTIVFVWARGGSVRTPHWRAHAWRDLSGVIASLGFFVAVGGLPIATATTLCYTGPLFMALLSAVVLKERLSLLRTALVTVGFLGVALLLLPRAGVPRGHAAIAGVMTGFLTAVAHLSTRRLGKLGEPPWRIVFYFNLAATLVAGAITAALGFHRMTAWGALVLLGLGTAELLAQLSMTRAYREGDTLTVGSYSYSTVAFSAALGIALWSDTLVITSWLAIALIAASGMAVSRTAPR